MPEKSKMQLLCNRILLLFMVTTVIFGVVLPVTQVPAYKTGSGCRAKRDRIAGPTEHYAETGDHPRKDIREEKNHEKNPGHSADSNTGCWYHADSDGRSIIEEKGEVQRQGVHQRTQRCRAR